MRGQLARAAAAALVFLAAAGAACVRYEPKPITASDGLAAVEARALDAPALKEYAAASGWSAAWPPPAWDLDALTIAAFYYHPDLDVARAEAMTARRGIAAAGDRPNPTLGVSAGKNTTTPASLLSPWLLTLNLTLPFETAGKRGTRMAQAGHLSEAARLHIGAVAWQVRGRLRRTLLAYEGARRSGELLALQLEAHDENVRILERMHEDGAVSPFEVTQGRLARAAAAAASLDAKRRMDEARVQLAEAVGITADAMARVELSGIDLERPALSPPDAAARREALVNRADVLQALAEYEAAQSALQLAIAKQYPDLQIGPGYEYDQGDNKWTLGLSLSLPIFSRNRGPIAEAEAKRAEAAARFYAVQTRAVAEVDQAIVALRGARERLTATSGLIRELTLQEERAAKMLEEGEISRQELVTRQIEARTAALTRLEAVTASEEAIGRLEEAMARPADLARWLPPATPEAHPEKAEAR